MSFVTCAEGHRHFGAHGAAGLLLIDEHRVLLQKRSAWVHLGGTWSIPGGARDPDESPLACAFREAHEEVGISTHSIDPLDEHVAKCGGWTYTTILANPVPPVGFRTGWETGQLAWVPVVSVSAIADLHPAFAASWPALKELI